MKQTNYLQLFDHTPVPTYIWKKIENKVILENYNRSAAEFSGSKIKQLVGITVNEAFADTPQLIEAMNQCYKLRQPVIHELDMPKRTTGEIRHLKCTWICVDQDTLIYHVQDLTYMKKIEIRLKQEIDQRTHELQETNTLLRISNQNLSASLAENLQKEQFLNQVIDSIQEGICILDPNMNVLKINKTMEKLYDLQPTIIGDKCYRVFQKDRQQVCDFCPALKSIEEKVPNKAIVHAVRGDDQTDIWTEVFTFPMLNDSGDVDGIIEFVRDITERKRLEAEHLELETQLRQKYKMEAVGVMAGGMAHNFNNNLSIILGNLELSQLKVKNPEVMNLLSNAKIAVKRSRDLVSQIMKYSRKGSLSKISLQLPLIIDETIQLLSSTIPSTVQIKQTICDDCKHATVLADASQIQECLLNLCNNAVHAMEEKGTLHLHLNSVEITKEDIPARYQCQPGQYARLSVQDTGCGISTDIIEKIFDPFFTTKELHYGTGMGLASVHGIIEQHGGMITVESIVSKGSVFNLYFPMTEQIAISEPTSDDQLLTRGTEQILFIDDDEMLANVGMMMLAENGYTVSVMNNSQEALKLFAANADRFDLVITDQTMPELCGKDLIQEIKKIRLDIPTILCTGYSSKIDEDKAEELGINAFMLKPLELSILLQTVRQVLDRDKGV